MFITIYPWTINHYVTSGATLLNTAHIVCITSNTTLGVESRRFYEIFTAGNAVIALEPGEWERVKHLLHEACALPLTL